ncbi:MAG: GTP-binding protein, partial [Candidatus Nanohaloarchaea archaeon]|nr:GTP-binding protein [Candidatus Nanohaloarchaea archaeon]
MGIDEELEKLQRKLEETPVNKATETERARLKARIAELKEEREKR